MLRWLWCWPLHSRSSARGRRWHDGPTLACEACQRAVGPPIIHQRQPLFVGLAGAQAGHQVLVPGASLEVEHGCRSLGLPTSLQGAWVEHSVGMAAEVPPAMAEESASGWAGHTATSPWLRRPLLSGYKPLPGTEEQTTNGSRWCSTVVHGGQISPASLGRPAQVVAGCRISRCGALRAVKSPALRPSARLRASRSLPSWPTFTVT